MPTGQHTWHVGQLRLTVLRILVFAVRVAAYRSSGDIRAPLPAVTQRMGRASNVGPDIGCAQGTKGNWPDCTGHECLSLDIKVVVSVIGRWACDDILFHVNATGA